GAAEGRPELGLRAHASPQDGSWTAPAPSEGRKIPAVRSGRRSRFSRQDRAQFLKPIPARYNAREAKSHDGSNERGGLSYGSKAGLRKRLSDSARKGVGDQVAGARDRSRRI